MLNDGAPFSRIYLKPGKTDLRKGIDGLATIVKTQIHLDPFEKNVLFLFCGSSPTKIKGLVWEGDGFLLMYKRLETGKFQWPRTESELRELTVQQYRWLTEGLSIEQKKSIPKVYPGSYTPA